MVVATVTFTVVLVSAGFRVSWVPLTVVPVVVGFLAGVGLLLECVLCGFWVVVRSGGVGLLVVTVAFVVVVGAAVVVVVVLLVVLLADPPTELLTVGLVCRLVVVVVSCRWEGSVTVGVVVSTIWKVTNFVGTVVVSMRCSTAPVVSTGLAVVVRRRGGFTVATVAFTGAVLGLRVVRTTKCEFLWVVCGCGGRRVVARELLPSLLVVRTGLAVLRYDWVTFLSSSLVVWWWVVP